MHPEMSQWYIYACIEFNWNISKIVSLQHFSDSSPRSITSTLQQKKHFCCKFAHFLYQCHGFFFRNFTNQRIRPGFRFTTTWPFEVLIARPWGGKLIAGKLDSSRPLSFRRFGGETKNARLSMMMEVMRPLVPFDPWLVTLVAVENPPPFSPPKKTPGMFVWPRKLRWNLEFERNDDVVEKGTCICTAEDHGALIVAATSPQFCGCLHSYWSCSWSIILIGNMPSQIEESGETHIFIPPEVQHSQWKGIPQKENTHPSRHFSGAIRSYFTPNNT